MTVGVTFFLPALTTRKISGVILILVLLFTIAGGITIPAQTINKIDHSDDYSHTVFAELATSTGCHYCQFAHGALKNIYEENDYPFYYISLVGDKNTYAYDILCTEFGYPNGKSQYPEVFFDGGLRVDVGSTTIYEAEEKYRTSIPICGSREVPEIESSLSVGWLGDGRINIALSVQNHEATSYQGHLRVYVTEIESARGWIDSGGHPYTFAFLGYAQYQNVNIDAEDVWTNTTVWDGNNHNDGYGHSFGDITSSNIMVFAIMYNATWHQGYANPPDSWPFDAYYTDEAIGAKPNNDNNEPPTTPSIPLGPITGLIYINYLYSTSTIDPNFDSIWYNFSWGDSSTSGWMGPFDSGDVCSAGHTWCIPGTYEVRAKAKDIYGSESNWSDSILVVIEENLNQPPATPTTPSGPQSGIINIVYNYTSLAVTDPNGDDVFYNFSFGDGTYSGWIVEPATSHSWVVAGTYEVMVKAKDSLEAESNWSSPSLQVIIIQQVPILNITTINGGIGVSVVITNIGNANATNVTWAIHVNGGILGLIDKATTGVIPTLAVGTEALIKSRLIYGFGSIVIQVRTTCNEESSIAATAEGKVLLIFVKM